MSTAQADMAALPPPRGAVVLGADFQALGLVRSLGRRGIPVYVCSAHTDIARFSRYAAACLRLPEGGNGTRLLRFLLGLAVERRLAGWLLFPNDDDQVEFLSRHHAELSRFYRVCVPQEEAVAIVSDKRLTYGFAQEHGIPAPRTWTPENEEELAGLKCPYPVILKPARRNPFFRLTGRKAFRADDWRELVALYRRLAPLVAPGGLMVQELIPGGPRGLYSFAALAAAGEPVAWLVANRLRQHPMDFGRATTFATTVTNPELAALGRRILKRLSFDGLCEVEFMHDPRDGAYKFLEINARIWGWHSLGAAAGIDFPYLLFRLAAGKTCEAAPGRQGARWVRLLTDLPTAAAEVVRGRLGWREMVDSYRSLGTTDAVYAKDDPMPFFMELMLLPYLIRKKR